MRLSYLKPIVWGESFQANVEQYPNTIRSPFSAMMRVLRIIAEKDGGKDAQRV
jgi:hypothetical protein